MEKSKDRMVGGMKMAPPASSGEEGEKESVLDEIVSILKKLLNYCLCCLTCGCYPNNNAYNGDVCESELTDTEKQAVQNLLEYLDSAEARKNPTINEERLHALCILTYSDNQELQRSAALCFAEISDRMSAPVTERMLEPLVILLKSKDVQVLKAATLAISNFALNGPDTNKASIMMADTLKPLVGLLGSKNVEVQCNTCGCLTTLATTDKNKHAIVSAGGIKPLLQLSKSSDIRVQRNATGALLNLTHLQSNRNQLVAKGAIPILIETLHSFDADVQYYCTAALGNMAVNEKHRTMIVAVEHYLAVRRLISLLSMGTKEKVICQSCLALRNLASDGDNQVLIVKLRGLQALHAVLEHSMSPETITAAMACIRNLSIHKANEEQIVLQTFLKQLPKVLEDLSNPEAQMHAAGTLRNLAAGDLVRVIIERGCLRALTNSLLDPSTTLAVLSEVTAALAVMADADLAKEHLLSKEDGQVFERLVYLAESSEDSDIQYNCAGTIGQIAVTEIPHELMEKTRAGLLKYLQEFLGKVEPSFVHVALWSITQLQTNPTFKTALLNSSILAQVQRIANTSQSASTIRLLAREIMDHHIVEV